MIKSLPVLAAALLVLGTPAIHTATAQEQPVQVVQAGSGIPLYINPSTIRDVQKALNKQGFSTGNVDGMWGSDTETAMKSFQKENDLDPTGKPDIATLAKLNIDLGIGTTQLAQEEQEGADSAAKMEPAAGEPSENTEKSEPVRNGDGKKSSGKSLSIDAMNDKKSSQ